LEQVLNLVPRVMVRMVFSPENLGREEVCGATASVDEHLGELGVVHLESDDQVH
jgi:hypothetical protein